MLFNIYYMNFSKVYEIKMMLSNIIKTDGSIETSEDDTIDAEMQAKMGAKFLKLFNADIGAGVKSGSTDSQKVLENFKVTMTKSLILSEVMGKCKFVTDFSNLSEGQLVRIDNVSLSLENETELRTVKMFSNGSFKGMRLPEAGGLDINNLFNSMFKDYSYKLKGEIKSCNEKVLIKIPLTFESEFENLYNVDDLFIGNVSLIGIYKGKTKINGLKNSFEFFQELGQVSNSDTDSEVHNSQYTVPTVVKLKSENDGVDYNYIDLLAIIQVIKSEDTEIDEKLQKAVKKKKATK
ncbi:hypothetical protein [uncultured Ruminococcus sp.]|uniref:hypothetical protein n=1 Tax=uncultured Ruminococcus sp. TaxID=165186 RepID=UPI0025DBD28F|nr:hypothetical protein [uncultured Ruminococcus sp.]MCI6825418.1 hypothetical protein [Ruminococcus bromii]